MSGSSENIKKFLPLYVGISQTMHTHSISELKLAYWQHFIGSSIPIYHIWILYGMHRVSDCDQFSPLSSEYKGSTVRPGYGRAPLIRFDLFHPGLISIVLYVSGNLHNVCDKPVGSYSIKPPNSESVFFVKSWLKLAHSWMDPCYIPIWV